MRELILDLCGGTGSWSKPWIEAGYDVRIVDLITTGEDVRLLALPKRQPLGILAAPPCTHFSQSGAQYWRQKGDQALLDSLAIVDACLRYVTILKPKWWALENPEGRLRYFLGKPTYLFHPYEFGHPYSKKTLLWGNFNTPIKNIIEPTLQHGQNDPERPDRQLKRSMTFSGFAQAFYEANR